MNFQQYVLATGVGAVFLVTALPSLAQVNPAQGYPSPQPYGYGPTYVTQGPGQLAPAQVTNNTVSYGVPVLQNVGAYTGNVDGANAYLSNTTVSSAPQVLAQPEQAQIVTTQGLVNPYAPAYGAASAIANTAGVHANSGVVGLYSADGVLNLDQATNPNPNRYYGAIDYSDVLQQNPQVQVNQVVVSSNHTDMYDYASYAGRAQASNYYAPQYALTAVDRTPLTAKFDEDWQRQYAVTSEITRQLDYQNRTSGWRIVEPAQPAPVVQVVAQPRRIAIENIYFDFDRDFVRQSEIDRVQRIASILATDPSYTVVVSGHTDMAGNDTYNQALSHRRSLAAANALASLGVNPQRIQIAHRGESDLVAPPEHQNGAQQLNRRVTFTIIQNGQAIAASGR